MKIFLLVCFLRPSLGFYPKERELSSLNGNNFMEPLILTPLLEGGNRNLARENSSVLQIKGSLTSFSGFLTVDKTEGSNIFFWYFPREKGGPHPEGGVPLILWLQGGPGTSSLYGIFNEIGPFYVKKQRGLKMRNHYWSKEMNVLFMDAPVGTGFSYTEEESGFKTTSEAVANDLYGALIQFFALFPELVSSPFYIHGESYGAKFATALAYTILRSRKVLRINLNGVIYGSGWFEPVLGHSDVLWHQGFLDDLEKIEMIKIEQKIQREIKLANWESAYDLFEGLLLGQESPSLFNNLTHLKYCFNYQTDGEESPYGRIGSYIQKDVFRRAIHVGKLKFTQNDNKVLKNLKNDVMKSVKPMLQFLLENTRVLMYGGISDVLSAPSLFRKFLNSLDWKLGGEFRGAHRSPWLVKEKLAGYAKEGGGLTWVLVRNAGHLVPFDQPLWALDMITRFISKKPFS